MFPIKHPEYTKWVIFFDNLKKIKKENILSYNLKLDQKDEEGMIYSRVEGQNVVIERRFCHKKEQKTGINLIVLQGGKEQYISRIQTPQETFNHSKIIEKEIIKLYEQLNREIQKVKKEEQRMKGLRMKTTKNFFG